MPWVKGQSGNPQGRQRKSEITDALRALLHKRVSEIDTRTNRAALVDTLVKLALTGDMLAIKTVIERIDGKVPEQLQHTGADGVPLVFTIAIGEHDGANSDEA